MMFCMSATQRRQAPAPVTGDGVDLGELVDAVTDALRGLRYGSVEVVVHDSRIVQIIRTEKRHIAK
jgi:hypothetical protein